MIKNLALVAFVILFIGLLCLGMAREAFFLIVGLAIGILSERRDKGGRFQ